MLKAFNKEQADAAKAGLSSSCRAVSHIDMKIRFLPSLILCLTLIGCVEGSDKPNGLSCHVEGLMTSYDIVTKQTHPVSYLCSLKVKDTSAILNGQERYKLARTLLDVHHLCQALSHQGYYIDPKKCPILQLAEKNFKGFKQLCVEGGYYTGAIADYFESGKVEWGVDSSYEKQDKPEQPH